MQKAAPTIKASPRHAPVGADARLVSSATATPDVAIRTPAVLRRVNGSTPSAAATTIVSNGKVDSASAPRAAVVKISDALNRIGNRPKNSRPRPATAAQSLRAGHLPPCSSATGNRKMKPRPNRNAPIASGSTACRTKRVAPIELPPSPLDSTADRTPQISPIAILPLCRCGKISDGAIITEWNLYDSSHQRLE